MPDVKRYRFFHIFTTENGTLRPEFNVRINGILYPKGTPILVGTTFGGLNLYNYIGRAIAGTWDDTDKVLDIAGFYK